ncbi:MAG: SAF domain-containing protein [Chloroflexi bacterium]|nr:SAF domain-containing protein [Chloroflexota bacterium]
MRRGRVFILLALILLVGAVAAFFVLQPRAAEPVVEAVPTPIGEAEIVIAAQHISRGSLIPPEAVIVSPFPADYKVETMLDDPGQVVGKRARMDIGRGVPITENMITDQPGDLLAVGSDASIAIPRGFTAIAMPMDRFSGVAFALREGDQVDILVSMLIVDLDTDFQSELPNEAMFLFNPDGQLLSAISCRVVETAETGELICSSSERPPTIGLLQFDEFSGQDFYAGPSGPQRPRLVTQRMITSATVLGVGDFPPEVEQGAVQTIAVPQEEGVGAPEAQAQAQQAGEQAPPVIVPPDIITLIVSPQDALAIHWAVNAGLDLTLTLRSPNDPTPEIDTDSVTLQFMIDNYDIAVPSKLPYGTEPRLTTEDFVFPPDFEVTATPAP